MQPSAAAIAAARWVPAKPTYLLASKTLGEAQRSLREAIDLLGTAGGFDLRDAARVMSSLVGVDALEAERLTEIGVDLRASWALFSEDLSPTLVVHLAAPDQMAAFLDGQRKRGLITQSVIVDGTELCSATLVSGVKISWAIAGDWMWIHLALPFARDSGTSWFTASHAPHEAAWADSWAWAQRAAGAAADLVGFFDLHGAIAEAVARAPDAVACARLFERVGRAAVSLDGDGHQVTARIAVAVGSSAGIRGMVLPPPSGWAATAAQAALAVQWNLDLGAAQSALAPCLAAAGLQRPASDARRARDEPRASGGDPLVSLLGDVGVRAARAVLLAFDPAAMSGSGAIALDVTDSTFIARSLDRIPLRRAIERARTFGAYKGHAIAIPFSVTIEYVLEPTFAMVGLGEGVLARLAAPGPASSSTIFALDVAPPAMSSEAWASVIHIVAEQRLSGAPGPATRRVVERLMQWRDGHLAVTAEAGDLVLTLSGTRR